MHVGSMSGSNLCNWSEFLVSLIWESNTVQDRYEEDKWTLELHSKASLCYDFIGKSNATVLSLIFHSNKILHVFWTVTSTNLWLTQKQTRPLYLRISSSSSPCSHHNEVSLFQITPVNYTCCLNMEQILLFWDQPAPQGSGRLRHPLILTARGAPVTLRGWFIPIIWDPGDPPCCHKPIRRLLDDWPCGC